MEAFDDNCPGFHQSQVEVEKIKGIWSHKESPFQLVFMGKLYRRYGKVSQLAYTCIMYTCIFSENLSLGIDFTDCFQYNLRRESEEWT